MEEVRGERTETERSRERTETDRERGGREISHHNALLLLELIQKGIKIFVSTFENSFCSL
jgi:hypothetical protein